jgi:uncharacterized protein
MNTPLAAGPAETRDAHIDALRGAALGGILLVNIMSFALGLDGGSLGRLDAASSTLDMITVALVAFLAEFKFYPIFAFLFGYGFMLFWRRGAARGADIGALYNRRMIFLGIVGVAHGLFIWFGDILSRYAVVAIILKKRLAWGPKAILASAQRWFIVALVLCLALAISGWVGMALSDAASATLPPSTAAPIYATGDYWAVTRQRAADYLFITLIFVILIPQVLVLFLLGALAARMGWLHHPARHHALWRRLLAWGLVIGVPLNLVWAALQLGNASVFNPMMGPFIPLLDLFMPLQSAAMVAAFMLALPTRFMQRVVSLLAPAGRMPLTNYLAQSVICSFLLYGYGLGLGDDLRQAGLAGLALAVYGAQIVFSRWWLARYELGPMEAVWRRYVYRAAQEKP